MRPGLLQLVRMCKNEARAQEKGGREQYVGRLLSRVSLELEEHVGPSWLS